MAPRLCPRLQLNLPPKALDSELHPFYCFNFSGKVMVAKSMLHWYISTKSNSHLATRIGHAVNSINMNNRFNHPSSPQPLSKTTVLPSFLVFRSASHVEYGFGMAACGVVRWQGWRYTFCERALRVHCRFCRGQITDKSLFEQDARALMTIGTWRHIKQMGLAMV